MHILRYATYALFSACVIKSLIVGISFPEAAPILILGALVAIAETINAKSKHKQFEDLKAEVEAKFISQNEKIQTVSNEISGIKMSGSIKQLHGRPVHEKTKNSS